MVFGIDIAQAIVAADDDADGALSAHGVGVLFGQSPGIVGREIRRIVSIQPLQGVAALPHAVEGVQGAGEDRDAAKKVGMLESPFGRAGTAHRESLDHSAFARGDGAIGRVDVRDQVLDRHAFHRLFAIVGIDIASCREAIDEDDDHRRRLAFLDGPGQPRNKGGDACLGAAAAVQPVHHGIARFGVGFIIRREINQVADRTADRGAFKGFVKCAGRFDRLLDPLRRFAGFGGESGNGKQQRGAQRQGSANGAYCSNIVHRHGSGSFAWRMLDL
ncbi:MAG: hypothetical protein BWZ10_02861 [candidate division BRC1 bacterium ADurb.BinA364]|nr:MAG: hypothetical protein BWZ10_02861 [candidate division BRC1 bacterium ADurb.BinA364]